MIRNDTTWTNKIKSLERTIQVEIVSKLHNHSYIDEVSNVKLNEIGFSSDVICFGEICSNKLTFKLYITDLSLAPIKGDVLTLKQSVDNETIQLGKYMIEEVKDDDNSSYYEVTAYDCLYVINNVAMNTEVENGTTGGQILTKLNTYFNEHYGVKFSDSDITKANAFVYSGLESGIKKLVSIKEELPKIIQFLGYNVRCDSNGNPTLYWLTQTNYEISYDEQLMGGFTRNNKNMICVDSITVKVSDDTSYSVSRSETPVGDYEHIDITFENSYFTQSQLTALQSRLDLMVYQPSSIKFRGNPAIEVGDIVKVETRDGDTLNVIVGSIETSLTGMSASLECKGISGKSSTGGVSSKVEALSNELHSDYINAKEINTNYAKIDLANIDIANINVAKVKQLYAEQGIVLSLQAGVIDAATANTLLANISNATVQNQATKLLLASSLVAQEGVIESIKGSNLTLEDSNGNKILLDGATQGFYDSEGNLRVAIGDNTTGDFSIWVFDEDGNELFNPTGVTYNGLLQGDVVKAINTDGKVSLINSNRLNISSLVDALNGENYVVDANGDRLYVYKNLDDEIIDLDTSLTKAQQRLIYQWDYNLDSPRKFYLYSSLTRHLKASAIYYDEEEQTMDVLFADLKESGEVLQSSYKMSNGLLDYVITNVNPTALTTKPSDWDSAYYKYYSKGSDGQYYHLQEKEVFESGKFYQPSSSVTNLRMNQKSIQLIADNIDLTGKVTFNSFDSGLQTTINNKANTSDIPDVSDMATKTELESGTTIINGGCITTGTIDASKVSVSNLVVGENVTMGDNATISWSNVTSQPTIPSKTSQLTNDSSYATTSQLPDVSDMATKTGLSSGTTIINGGCITTGTIDANKVNVVNVKAASVDAENITGTTITGKTIKSGTILLENSWSHPDYVEGFTRAGTDTIKISTFTDTQSPGYTYPEISAKRKYTSAIGDMSGYMARMREGSFISEAYSSIGTYSARLNGGELSFTDPRDSYDLEYSHGGIYSDSSQRFNISCAGGVTIAPSGLNGTCRHLLLGDDAYLGDCNVGGAIGIRAYNNDLPSLVFVSQGGSNRGGFRMEDSSWIRTNGTGEYKSIYLGGAQVRSDAKEGIKSEAGDFGFSQYRSDTGHAIYFGIGKSGDWKGLYDYNQTQYILARKPDGTTNIYGYSDKRKKNYLGDLSLEESASLLDEIQPIIFTYKGVEDCDEMTGIFAQDYRDWAIRHNVTHTKPLGIFKKDSPEEEVKDLTHDEEDVWYHMDYRYFIPDLWNGWKYHQQKIKDLEEENKSLKSRLDDLEARLSKLENGSDI